MQYKIVVDKQSRTNPSAERREYIIDIEELRCKGDVYDSLVITKDEDYVMRRLELTEYHVLNILDNPIKEPLNDFNIELFEGDNYIYLIDMVGNKFYAEYIVKNDFTDTYITKAEFNSGIEQTAKQIELSVNEKLTGYSTTEEMNAAIKLESDNITSSVSRQFENVDKSISNMNSKITQTAESITSSVAGEYATKDELTFAKSEIKQTTDSITSTVSKKVGNDEIISKINQSAETITISASKLNINGTVSANGGFKILQDGSMQAVNGTFTGGKVELNGGTTSNPKFSVKDNDYTSIVLPNTVSINKNANYNKQVLSYVDDVGGGITIGGKSINDITLRAGETTEICCYGEIKGTKITNMSLESLKKNIEKFGNASSIVKNSDIYTYNLKTEEDTDKKHIGFVIGDNYNTPKEVMSNTEDAIDLYSMVSILWQAVQEQQKQIEKLKEVKYE